VKILGPAPGHRSQRSVICIDSTWQLRCPNSKPLQMLASTVPRRYRRRRREVAVDVDPISNDVTRFRCLLTGQIENSWNFTKVRFTRSRNSGIFRPVLSHPGFVTGSSTVELPPVRAGKPGMPNKSLPAFAPETPVATIQARPLFPVRASTGVVKRHPCRSFNPLPGSALAGLAGEAVEHFGRGGDVTLQVQTKTLRGRRAESDYSHRYSGGS